MTDDRMALLELPQKSGDTDFLRAVMQLTLQRLMAFEVEGPHRAGRSARSSSEIPASLKWTESFFVHRKESA